MNGQKPGSGGAGGNGGGQAPSAADCKCSVCSVCGGCTDLEILKSFKDNGEDGGAMINCPVCSCPVVDVTGFEDNDKAKCIYQKLISGRILSDFIDRYFAPTEQNHSLLGELNLTWTTGNCAGDAIAETIPISIPDNNSYYSVEIRMDEEKLAQNSSSIIALTMLHEALHAKLMAEYYDEVGSTDYKALYAYYNGWGLGGIDKNQEYEMMNLYANEMAQALKDFDKTQGINYPLDFYKEVLKYDFSNQLGLDRYETGNDEYHLFYSSSKNCK